MGVKGLQETALIGVAMQAFGDHFATKHVRKTAGLRLVTKQTEPARRVRMGTVEKRVVKSATMNIVACASLMSPHVLTATMAGGGIIATRGARTTAVTRTVPNIRGSVLNVMLGITVRIAMELVNLSAKRVRIIVLVIHVKRGFTVLIAHKNALVTARHVRVMENA